MSKNIPSGAPDETSRAGQEEKGLLSSVIESTPTVADRRVLTMNSGRQVEIGTDIDGADIMTISGVDDQVELQITFTGQGPKLCFKSADVAISSPGKVAIDCAEFHLKAAKGIKQETNGTLRQDIGGDVRTVARGDLENYARVCKLKAVKGNVNLEANDDVKLDGERVLLNC